MVLYLGALGWVGLFGGCEVNFARWEIGSWCCRIVFGDVRWADFCDGEFLMRGRLLYKTHANSLWHENRLARGNMIKAIARKSVFACRQNRRIHRRAISSYLHSH